MTQTPPITVLGAGIAGLSAAYHFGHERCAVFERLPHLGGHTRSERTFGYTFDQGPHISFTKHTYVRDLFTRSTGGEVREFDVRTRNYFRGAWIDHPAQVHLWQVPEPLRDACYRDMLAAAKTAPADAATNNYQQWLNEAFGRTFAETFPAAYTRKYWTTDARNLSIDWLGPRVHRPTREQVEEGIKLGATQSVHYITRVRYPSHGGYQSFLAELARGVRLHPGKEVASIDLAAHRLWMADGTRHDFHRLVSTLPLDAFINRCQNAPDNVRDAAGALACTQLLLVNVCAPHPSAIDGHWFYVYDEDKLSTRIHYTDRLSPNNAPPGSTGVQVEVYFGPDRPLSSPPAQIADTVVSELVEMGFINQELHARGEVQVFWRWAPYANITFTHGRRAALDTIFSWLEQYGLTREAEDLDATTDWGSAAPAPPQGELMLAGRFAQWKYFWTDDCVLRGRQLAGIDR